jgi:hypothetical protein
MSDCRTFFVSDGYCNSRIIKYHITSISANGYHSVVKVMSFGAQDIPMLAQQPNVDKSAYQFNVPHAVTVIESMKLICVADRENGRIQCFDMNSGTFDRSIKSLASIGRIYSIGMYQ